MEGMPSDPLAFACLVCLFHTMRVHIPTIAHINNDVSLVCVPPLKSRSAHVHVQLSRLSMTRLDMLTVQLEYTNHIESQWQYKANL